MFELSELPVRPAEPETQKPPNEAQQSRFDVKKPRKP